MANNLHPVVFGLVTAVMIIAGIAVSNATSTAAPAVAVPSVIPAANALPRAAQAQQPGVAKANPGAARAHPGALQTHPRTAQAHTEAADETPPVTILFFGNSITAGYGLDIDNAFPSLIQKKADSLGYNINAVNAGVSGETSAGGLRRVDWVLQREIDIFVLELGGNDGLRGTDPENTRQNLQAIMDKVTKTYPDARIVLTGMEAPPNMGDTYMRQFREIYRDLAESNDVVFMPFILEGVAGDPDLNQADRIHPTAEGHRIIASHLWEKLEPLLQK